MFISHPLIKEGKVEERDYQVEIAKKCLESNTLVVLPTGLGKTNIALLVCAEKLDKDDGKILFLAPTKPLIEQHKKTFEKLSEIKDLEVVSGHIKPEKRRALYEMARVVFATPQTIANDLKNGALKLDDFILLIVDEAHHSIGNYAYTYIAERYMREAEKPLILGLTASPGGKINKIEEIKKNLFINQVEAKSEFDEKIRKYVKEKEIIRVDIELPEDYKVAKKLIENIIEKKIEYLVGIGALPTKKISKKTLLDYHSLYTRKANSLKKRELYLAVSKISELIKLDYCLELLETQGKNQVLEYFEKLKKEKTKAARSIILDRKFNVFINKVKTLKEHPKIDKIKELVSKEIGNKIIIFTQYRSSVKEIKKNIKEIEGAKVAVLIGQKSGLNQKKQVSIIRDFENGIYNILICTSIGEEGLDIKGADIAIFYEPIPSEIRQIQRRGRVGRLIEGKVYVLVAKGTRDEAYYWTAYHKEKKMRKYLENKLNKLLIYQ
jgi:Fanconi anemia group M protein